MEWEATGENETRGNETTYDVMYVMIPNKTNNRNGNQTMKRANLNENNWNSSEGYISYKDGCVDHLCNELAPR
eukprot:scaffold594001_cov14-Prasinocladus_malaysianus.AAC.1